MTLTYSIEEVEDGYVLDMGDIGLAIIGPCEVSEVLEAMQIINDNGIPVM